MIATRWICRLHRPPSGARPGPPAPGDRLNGRREMPAMIPAVNPLTEPLLASQAREAALSIVDPDVYGYLLVTVHKHTDRPYAHIALAGHLEDSWWPAVEVTLLDVLEAAPP
jgi:hypothetical protein